MKGTVVSAVALSAAVFAAACGQGTDEAADDDGNPADDEFAAHGQEVAESWSEAEAEEDWDDEDFALLDEPASFGDDVELDAAQESGFQGGWYELEADLPDELPSDTAELPQGSVEVDVFDAETAYDTLAVGGEPPAECPSDPDEADSDEQVCGVLTISDADPTTTQRWTSQGMAELPAWEFTVEGVQAPLTMVAFEADDESELPRADVDDLEIPEDAKPAENLETIDDSSLTYNLGIGSCDTDVQPLVHETEDVIVVAGTAVHDGSEACTEEMVYEPVTVELDAPVDQRTIVDAVSGKVLSKGDAVAPA